MKQVPAAPLVLHAAPAAGFDAPFELLAACHARVRRTLALGERLMAHLQSTGADAQAAEAARDVMRYFDRAAPAHHEDEERHVLPRLRALGLAALADRLHAEHAAMSAAWQALLPSLLLVADRQRPPSVNTLAAAWADFARLYAGHLAAEDELAFPAAMESLDAAVLQAIGAEMAARRGLR